MHWKRKFNIKPLEFDDQVLACMAAHPNDIVVTFGDEVDDESAGLGRSDNLAIRNIKKQGKLVRENIKIKLASTGLSRVKTNWFMTQSGRSQLK